MSTARTGGSEDPNDGAWVRDADGAAPNALPGAPDRTSDGLGSSGLSAALALGSAGARAAEFAVRATEGDAATSDFRPPWTGLRAADRVMLADGFADDPLTSGVIGADPDVPLVDRVGPTRGAAVTLWADGRLAGRTLSPIGLGRTEAIALATGSAEGAPPSTGPRACIESGGGERGPMGAPPPWLEAGVDAKADVSFKDGAPATPTAEGVPSPTSPGACIESGAEDEGPTGAPPT
jgi:hypothetical protein